MRGDVPRNEVTSGRLWEHAAPRAKFAGLPPRAKPPPRPALQPSEGLWPPSALLPLYPITLPAMALDPMQDSGGHASWLRRSPR